MSYIQAMMLNADGKFHHMHNSFRAIALAKTDRVTVIHWWDDMYAVATQTRMFPVPALMIYHKYIKVNAHNRPATLIRENLFKRDDFTCQYCGNQFSYNKLTVDHVVPRGQNGEHSWTNCVTACLKCNNRKDNRTPEQAGMPLLNVPYVPKFSYVRQPSRKRISGRLHESWLPYLDEDKELKT